MDIQTGQITEAKGFFESAVGLVQTPGGFGAVLFILIAFVLGVGWIARLKSQLARGPAEDRVHGAAMKAAQTILAEARDQVARANLQREQDFAYMRGLRDAEQKKCIEDRVAADARWERIVAREAHETAECVAALAKEREDRQRESKAQREDFDAVVSSVNVMRDALQKQGIIT